MTTRRPGVIVAGFLADGLGLGEGARGYARALATAGCDVSLCVVAQPGRSIGHGDPGAGGILDMPVVDPAAEADVVVVCVNPPELGVWRQGRVHLPAGRANVGVWAYEVDPVPVLWRERLGRFDEMWAPSRYVAGLLDPAVDVPVVVSYPPVLPGDAAPSDLLDDDTPTFVALCDGASTFTRKNPEGAIEAFRRAFAPGEGPRLLVKVWNGSRDARAFGRLRAMADRDDIVVVDRWLPRREFLGLLRSALGLVSLHRAEGFGLPIAEAIVAGVPVVCTDATGIAELLDDDSAFLVRSARALVGPNGWPYPPDGRWREPDLDHAAAHLRRVWEDPVERTRRASTARSRISERLDDRYVGAQLRARVDALMSARGRESPRMTLRPAVSVVVHAATPWPALQPFLDAVAPQLPEADAELVIAASRPDVLPDRLRPSRVRVVPGPSRSPFDLRATALAHVDGDLVVVTEDHVKPCPSWLVEYAHAYATSGAGLLSGPVANGPSETAANWANYLISFAGFAPPLDDLPADRCPTIANLAVDATRLRTASGNDLRPGQLERELVPRWWADGEAVCVPGAEVQHIQPRVAWRHALAHFDDARTAGAYTASPVGWRDFTPGAVRAVSQSYLRGTAAAVADRPELAAAHRSARWWLRMLAAAKALGLVVGARWGEGHSATRVD